MSNEFSHKTVGTAMTQAEYESTTGHEADSQQANDMLYFNGTYWIRATPAQIMALLSGDAAAEFDFNDQNVNIGSGKLKTTNLLIKEGDSSTIHFKNAADDAYRDVTDRTHRSSAFEGNDDGAQVQARNVDGNYLVLRARKTGSGENEVARLVGATNPYMGYRCGIEHHTADDTLTVAETGTVHTNLGEDGAMTLTLPQDAEAGHWFHFVVMTAQELRVDPGAAGAIYINGAKQTDNMYISANDEGESVMLVCDGNGDWVSLYTVGTWTVES